MVKKIIFLISSLLICLVILAYTASADIKPANSNIQVFINNEKVQFDVEPRIINGRTFVPIRSVCEKMGADVYWNDGRILIVKNDIKIGLEINSNDIFVIKCKDFEHYLYIEAYVEGWEKYFNEHDMDTEPVIADGRTLLPIRYICEGLGASVKWNNQTRTVQITYSQDLINDINRDKNFAIEMFDYGMSKNLKRTSNATNHEERIQEALHLLKMYLWWCLDGDVDDYYLVTNTKILEGYLKNCICAVEFELKGRLPEKEDTLYYQIRFNNDGTYDTLNFHDSKWFIDRSRSFSSNFANEKDPIIDYKDRYNCKIGFLTLD